MLRIAARDIGVGSRPFQNGSTKLGVRAQGLTPHPSPHSDRAGSLLATSIPTPLIPAATHTVDA
jgi:hypothetical protein